MRHIHGAGLPPGPRSRGSGPWGWPALLIVLLGPVLGLLTDYGGAPGDAPAFVAAEDPPPEPAPDRQSTPNVHVSLHSEEPLAPDTTVVWTVAFQAAWDGLADTMGLADGIWLGSPAKPEALRVLNGGRLPSGIVEPDELTVIAGPDSEATWVAVDRVSDRPRPAYDRDAGPPGYVAFARLRASVRYEVPFFVAERPLHFGPRGVQVKAWGLRANASGASAESVRGQAQIHVPEGAPRDEIARHCVVVLTGAAGRRVVLSMRPPRDTLRATWNDVAAVLASAPEGRFSVVDSLTIPRVAITAGRSYDEIVPAFFRGVDAQLIVARQDLSLTVDERGADVDAEAVLVSYGAMPKRVEFDRPFLVALLAPESDAPYVLAWIGHEDSLSRWGAPVGRRMTHAEVRPFAGAWTIDKKASLEATLVAWRRVLDERDWGDWEAHLGGFIKGWAFDLTVGAGGAADVASHRPGQRARRASVHLRRDGARVLLALPWGDGGGPTTWAVSRHGDRLLLGVPSTSVYLVLRRP